MKTFLEFLRFSLISEEALNKDHPDYVPGNVAGPLHELLVGKHLNRGNHMDRHRGSVDPKLIDSEDENVSKPKKKKKEKILLSPKEAHDKLKSKISTQAYRHLNDKAKVAADSIKQDVEKGGHKIHAVHWTSKDGDIERSTGVKSSQKEDTSDIMIRTHHSGDKKKENPRYHGRSLKATESASHNVPGANYGLHPHDKKHITDYQKAVYKKHPKLANLSLEDRKKAIANSSIIKKTVKTEQTKALRKVATSTAERAGKMSQKELREHIRNNVMQAGETPLKKRGRETGAGHTSKKVTSYVAPNERGGKPVNQVHTTDPHTDYDHHLNNYKHDITVHHTPGTQSVHFKQNGKKIATHTVKVTSGSDVSSGKSTGIINAEAKSHSK